MSNWDTSSGDEFVVDILPSDLVHGRWSVKLGYVEGDEFGRTFYGATSFTGDGVSNWDTSRVTSLYQEHSHGATSFTGDGLSNWDTSKVTTLSIKHSTVRPRSREMDCQIGIRRV